MATIRSLADTSFDEIFEAFSIAFKDYEMQVNKDELNTLVNRRGFRKDLSFGAFDKGKLVSFTLNGIDDFMGSLTAYDTGTGTIADYRGKGLAGRIFDYSVPYLKNHGIKNYLLEVVQHNKAAVSLYKKAGFNITREFGYYVTSNSELMKRIPTCTYSSIPITIDEIMEASSFMDFEPSWQNSFSAIVRNPEMFLKSGVYTKDELVGFCVFEPKSGDITILAVKPEFRRIGIGKSLLHFMTNANKHENIKIINTDLKYDNIDGFLRSFGINQTGKQFEMIKEL